MDLNLNATPRHMRWSIIIDAARAATRTNARSLQCSVNPMRVLRRVVTGS
jgi:hypothetical protein